MYVPSMAVIYCHNLLHLRVLIKKKNQKTKQEPGLKMLLTIFTLHIFMYVSKSGLKAL